MTDHQQHQGTCGGDWVAQMAAQAKKKQFFCAEDFNSQSINHGWQKSTCYTHSFSACLHHLIVVRSKLLTSALLLFYRCFCAKKHQSTSFYLSPSYWANLKYDHIESSENKLVEALQKNNIWTIQIQFDSVSCQTQLNTKVNKKWPLSPDRRNFVWKQVIGVERPPIYLQFFSFLKRSIH